ncbi:MAG TPA: hypothetical protein DC049_10555, partial [Spirochaetia bacterium]|nr:hypothetical protein [Spirochaetia bacterium]
MKINIIALVSLLLSINIFCEGWHTLRTEFNIADKAAGKNLKIYKPKESGDKVDFKKDFAEIAASQWALAEITYTSSGGETIDSFPSQYANAKENVFLEIKLYYTQPVIGVEFKEKNWERWAKSFKIKNNEWNLIRIPFPPQGFALRKEGEQGNGVYNPENTSAVSVFAAAGHTLRIEYIRFVTDAEGPLSIPENKSGAEMKPEPPPIPGSAAKNFLPDPKNRKVKISGRKEQVLNAVKNQKVIWKNIAPGFMNVIIGAHLNKDVITLAIDIGGLVQTRDAGKSWQYLSYHMEGGMTSRSIFDFDISPANEKIIVIGGYKIYRTENGGLSWEEISQGLGPAAFMTKSSGFGQVKFNASGSVLYTAIGTKVWMPVGFEKTIAKNYPEKQIFISKNNAVSFITIDLKRPFAVIKCIYPHPNDNSIVYLSFGDGDFLILKDALENSREIISVAVPDGYFVRSMSIFPDDNEKMYMTLTSTSEKKSKPEVYILNNCRSAKPELEEKTIRFSGKFWNQDGIEKLPVDYGTIGFNPNRKNQVVIGSIQDNSVFISEDRGNTFAVYNLEEKFFMDDSQGAFYGNIERVYFGRNSPHAVIVSRIGAWITSDNFKTISDLTMKYEKGFYSS